MSQFGVLPVIETVTLFEPLFKAQGSDDRYWYGKGLRF